MKDSFKSIIKIEAHDNPSLSNQTHTLIPKSAGLYWIRAISAEEHNQGCNTLP